MYLNKEEYVAAWNAHIQKLQAVANDRYWNDVENYDRWKKLQADLKALVAEAADICFDRDDPRNPAK
jgi:hypothetical protein|tara:strand:- start:779 stop:979 length:201 start_codon:yes stop_codon:yes gene_type:complete